MADKKTFTVKLVRSPIGCKQSHRDTAVPSGVSRRRGPVIIAALVVVALIGSAILNGSRSDHKPSPSAPANNGSKLMSSS